MTTDGLKYGLIASALTLLVACEQDEVLIATEVLAPLPEPISNNAVAAVSIDGEDYLFSLLGLREGRTWRDTVAVAYKFSVQAGRWTSLPDVPGGAGRLAGTAVGVGDTVYVFGGYTVAEDGSEKSDPSVYALEPVSGLYVERAPMPVPVDDAVSVVFRDRFVILISGWHDTDNVDLVQVYDAIEDTWHQSTPYPGRPVFGHAGGLAQDRIVICDGVKVIGHRPEKRSFAITDSCYIGTIEDDRIASILWQQLPSHPGAPRYRMAAVGSSRRGGEIVFVGGTNNPYNYDGIGYDGEPSEPEARVFAYSLAGGGWKSYGRLDVATMDHRGLIEIGERFFLVGGMRAGQQVTDELLSFTLPTDD